MAFTDRDPIEIDGDAAARADALANVYGSIDALIDYATRRLELDPLDVDWKRNEILEMLGLDTYRGTGATSREPLTPDRLLGRFRDAIVVAGICTRDEAPIAADGVMGLLSARPSTVARRFLDEERDDGGEDAMRWLYDYCVGNDSVKKSELDANPRFDSHGLSFVIDLAKPEFAQEDSASGDVSGRYPACGACHENEGYAPRGRRTLRTVPLTLGGDDWFWRFKRYGVVRQHGVCASMEHTPLIADADMFARLIDFVDRFPGHFIGCDAASALRGGTAAVHEHYEGGAELLPLHRAEAVATFAVPGSSDAVVELLDWPGTAVRVVAQSAGTAVSASERIRAAWVEGEGIGDGSGVGEGAVRDGASVSASLIATDRGYEMNLILRAASSSHDAAASGAESAQSILGTDEIGLAGMQGLFVLPGRLADELGVLESDDPAGAAGVAGAEAGTVEAARDELGATCRRILAGTAVFAASGDAADFLASLGFARTAQAEA